MKKIWIFMLSLVVLGMQAQTRSLEEMRGMALQHFTKTGKAKLAAQQNQELKRLKTNTTLGVFGYDNGGFVVVSPDAEFGGIIGYSTNRFNDHNPGFNWWLTSQEMCIKNGVKPAKLEGENVNPDGVPMLCQTQWGQSEPYNLLVPYDYWGCLGEDFLFSSATGCVATAMSQICKYWECPKEAHFTNDYYLVHNVVTDPEKAFRWVTYEEYQQLGDNYEYLADRADGKGLVLCTDYLTGEKVVDTLEADIDYDTLHYDDMLYIYQDVNYDVAQARAVAQLMVTCGVATGMRYSKFCSGSESDYDKSVPGLTRWLGYYEPSMQYHKQKYYTAQEWQDMIVDELNAMRPLLYGGYNTDGGGHSFILDGYQVTEEGGLLYHFNYGWEGQDDGWFDLNNLQSSVTEGQQVTEFSVDQDMVIGITPADQPIDLRYGPQVGVEKLQFGYDADNDSIYFKADFINENVYTDENFTVVFLLTDAEEGSEVIDTVCAGMVCQDLELPYNYKYMGGEYMLSPSELEPDQLYYLSIFHMQMQEDGSEIDTPARAEDLGKCVLAFKYKPDAEVPGLYDNDDDLILEISPEEEGVHGVTTKPNALKNGKFIEKGQPYIIKNKQKYTILGKLFDYAR